MSYSALLLDLDGTLVSTIDVYKHAVIESFRSIDIEMTSEQFDHWYIQPVHLEGMLEAYNLTEEDVPHLRKLRDDLYINLLRTETKWIPGAKEFLESVQEKLPLCIVTGSHKSYVDAINESLGIYTYIQHYITADEMGNLMKPHPHGLLLAADLLQVDPKDCLYVGDQAFDMQAARAAGMTSCLIPTSYTSENAKEEADIVVENLEEVLELL